ncbi:cytochrome b [Herbaspirillum sp. RV1423]|uniref:cytochrome b n=1 Tax=Herbaspirillum sp. RV1423 TaxID=1443993 RepID=UPI0004B7518D|nr:cytochrome b [Herbaspirillum sp. RV1423]
MKTYHPASVFLHWLIFLLFVVALAAIEFRGEVPKGMPLRNTLKTVHMMAGQFVLLFLLFRVAARWRFGVPEDIAGPRWQIRSAQVVHLLLYAVMLALPVTGILFTQAGDKDVMFFGMAWPRFIAPNPDLKDTLEGVHELLGNAVYFLVGLHVAGALWHHFVRRDHIFQRMKFR